MRVFYFISSLLLTYFAEGQNNTFVLSCQPPLQEEAIVRSDTIWKPHTNTLLIVNSGKGNRLISQVTLTDSKNIDVFSFDNIKSARIKTIFYDSVKRVTYESISENGITFHCYTFRYDIAGRLTYKEGYSSGELGVKITYKYDRSGKLVREQIERASGKVTKEH